MITEETCINLYKQYGNMKDVTEHIGIEIIEKTFKQKTLKSRLMIDSDGNSTIFISPDTDVYNYEFLLAHELGHFILHYDTDISFSYFMRIYKTKTEQEANDFACRILLSDIDNCCNMEYIYKEKGIPEKVWYSYLDRNKQL